MVVKMSRKAGWTTALFGVGFATLALAQAPNPTDPAAVKAWQTKNSIQEKTANPATGWQSIGADTPGLLMRGVLAPRNAQGQSMIGLRIEFFTPQAGSQSELDSFLVDCTGNRIRQVTRAIYPDHNLGGAKKEEAIAESTADGAWSPTSDMAVLEGSIRASCAAPAGGGGGGGAVVVAAAGGGNTPNPNDLGAVNRWLTQMGLSNIGTSSTKWSKGVPSETSGWKMLGATPEGAFLGNQKVNPNVLNDTILDVQVRLERFQPKDGFLSQQTTYELNCRRKTVHIQVINEFPQHNISGTSRTLPNGPDLPAAQTPIKDEAQQICTDLGQ